MVNGKQEPAQLKIEIPANRWVLLQLEGILTLMGVIRYDMLCFEGISLMLNIFRGKRLSPNYRLVAPSNGELEMITVHEEVSRRS